MNMNKPKNGCILCNSNEYGIIFSYNEPDQYEKAVGVENKNYSRQWVKCKKCGFHYSVYSRDENILDKIYVSAYRSEKAPWRKGTSRYIFEKVIKLPENESETKFRIKWIKSNINLMWDSKIVERNKAPYKMLDIGGATGVFAYEFKGKDWISHVIDPNEDGQFMQTYGVNFVQSYYEPKKFKYKFDLISLVYVLEHLRNPIPLLKNLHDDMTKNSFLYIEVPDAISFKLKPREDDIFNSCHLWMFDPQSMITLLNKCGYQAFCLSRMKTIREHYGLMILAGQK